MTNTTTDAAEARALPVIQADRDAAIRLLEAGGLDQTAKTIRIGEGDHFPIVQAFARHRLATTADASGAEEVERLRQDYAALRSALQTAVDAIHLYLQPAAMDGGIGECHALINAKYADTEARATLASTKEPAA